MKWNNFALWATALGTSLFSVVATASDSVQKAAPLTPAAAVSSQDINAIARDVYLYAYPIVSMDLTMRQATNVPNASMISMRAPVNQFAHARAFPRADEKDVVRFNFDTLYSLAWLDIAPEPMVLTVPDTGGRYYLLEMLDMWSDVFSVVGSRTTGTKAGNFAIVAPGWSGTLPEGVGKIVAPTPAVWILGRTQTNGPADYANVHQIQDGYTLTPLSQWDREYTTPQDVPADPSVDTKTPPQTRVNRMNGVAVLTRLAELFSKYPPHANDYPILFRMRALGLEPGKPFDPGKLDPALAATINAAAKQALDGLAPAMRKMGKLVNGWNILTENVGTYGTSYKRRAVIALGGLGANLPEDAVYPRRAAERCEQICSAFRQRQAAASECILVDHMYDQDGFQVPNPINRFAIGDRDKLAFNADGSLDIYVQAEWPSKDKKSNWLPAPKNAPFQPTLRIYSPRPEVADGTWAPPPFRRMH